MALTRPGRLLTLAATVGFVLAACAGQGTTTPSAAAPTATTAPTTAPSAAGSAAPSAAAFDWKKYSGQEITFLANEHPWTDGMTPLLDQFTAETGIKVNVQPFSEDLYFDKMEQVLRANPGTADVYFLPMDSTAYSQFNAGLIEPLTPYLNDPAKTTADYDLADFPKGFQDPGTYPPGDASAQLYGIPISFETYILFSNKDLVDKYLGGVMPKTYDELVAAAEKINKDGAKDGVVGAVMRGIRSDTIMDTFSGVVYDAWGAKDAPPPYGLWFDGAWDKPRLTDPGVCAGMTELRQAPRGRSGQQVRHRLARREHTLPAGQGRVLHRREPVRAFVRGRDQVGGRRQGRLLADPASHGRRRLLHRPLAVGSWDPEERPEQGRRLVLHPVDDEQGEHGQDRSHDRWRAAAVVLL